MKVQITKEAKKWLKVAQMPAVRKIIADCKEEDICDLKEYGQMAASLAADGNYNFEILKASAEIAGNCRINDAFFDGSGHLDVYCKFYAFNYFAGFYEIGIYLTDLWKIGSEETNKEVRRNMYITAYKLEIN